MSLAVVAHGVRGVVVAGDDLLAAVVEGDCLQLRIDQAFRQRDQFRIAAGAPAHPPHFAVGPESDAPVRGNLLHAGLAVGDVSDGARLRQSRLHCDACAVEALVEELQLHHPQSVLLGCHEPLGMKADERGIVLMHALHRDSIRRGARGLR